MGHAVQEFVVRSSDHDQRGSGQTLRSRPFSPRQPAIGRVARIINSSFYMLGGSQPSGDENPPPLHRACRFSLAGKS